MRYPFLLIGGFAAAILLAALPARAELSVVTSIPPVHSLVAKVMAGAGEPLLLLRNGQSPHEYALRPSDARAIENADLIFLVSHTTEVFLEPAVDRNADHGGRVVELADASGVRHLTVREGTLWDAPEHGDDEGHAHDGHDKDAKDHAAHGHGPDDPHVWLSPSNAKAFVRAIAVSLAKRDPDRAGLYNANAEAARLDLEKLSATIRQKLA